MQRLSCFVLTAALGAFLVRPAACQDDPCGRLHQLIATTYDFRPSKLSRDQLNAKGKAMDLVWETVKGDAQALLPCLRQELVAPGADVMFRYDCSSLLAELDPSAESKAMKVACWTGVPLSDVDGRYWIAELSKLGFEGHDVSEAAAKWLVWPKASYRIPGHGLQEYKGEEGALFLLGSMDEAQATPALLRLITDAEGAARESALRIFTWQATPEALRAVKDVDRTGLPPRSIASLIALRSSPPPLLPSSQPSMTHAELQASLDGLLAKGDASISRFVDALTARPADTLAVLTEADLPRLRLARRRVAGIGNFHAIEAYEKLSLILLARIWTPDLVK